MNKTSVTLVLLCLLVGGRAQAETAAPNAVEERFVDVNGYHLFFNVQHGSKADVPTLVLEAGFGLDSREWSDLQPKLSEVTGATVVSYDRPGFGKSALPDKAYDITDEVEALHSALTQLGLEQNVILVGHSYGGLLIHIYASKWPATTRGLLFLDPNTPAVMLAAGADFPPPPPIRNPSTPFQRASTRIFEAGYAPFSAVLQSPLPLDVPVIVISAGNTTFTNPRLIRVFALAHELLVASVRDGKAVKAEGSNHMIPAQRPDLVISSVQELLAKHR